MPGSGFEARLIEVERGLRYVELQKGELKRRALAVAQGLREMYQPRPQAACGTIAVTVRESGVHVGAGFTVQMFNNAGPPHVLLGTATTDGSGTATFTISSAGTYNFASSDPVSTCLAGTATIAATCTANTLNLDLSAPTLTVNVKGCINAVRAGETVDFNGVTATTDSLGNATFPILVPGTFTLSTTAASARYAVDTRSVTVACANQTVNVVLTPAAGYVCFGCSEPVKDTLQISDGSTPGTYTFTYAGGQFSTCDNITTRANQASDPAGGCNTLTTATVGRKYVLSSPSFGHWTLSVFYQLCGLGGTFQLKAKSTSSCPVSGPAVESDPNPTGIVCAPFSLTFHLADATFTTLGTQTVTE